MSIYRDFFRNFIAPLICQFTEILWCPDNVNLQGFYGAPTMSIYRDLWCLDSVKLQFFAEVSCCPDYANLQIFYGAPTLSIHRDFMLPRLCQFTISRFCRDFMVPRPCQFTEILWCPDYVNLQGFYTIRLNM